LIVVQGPDENNSNLSSDKRKHITDRRIISNSQILKRRQLAHGVWNRSRQLIVVQVSAKSQSLCSDQRKHITNHRLFSNSQEYNRRQLAHDARNRAGQLIVVQRPAKSTAIPDQHPIVASFPTHSP
jgi:hypothetical protein